LTTPLQGGRIGSTGAYVGEEGNDPDLNFPVDEEEEVVAVRCCDLIGVSAFPGSR